MADTQTSTTEHDGADAVGADQVQDTVDAENEQGFRGVKADPTPDEHYTVAGVIAGKPTPETDADQHAEAHMVTRLEGRFPKSPEAPKKRASRG